ncbi:MAG TPA: response regulator [Polyangiaceae bacterium]|nr:response regulator [Polyangiaceae bacterium]
MALVGPTILIVDDDEFLRESVAEILEDDGFRTVSVESGASALRHLRSDAAKPDLILLDLMMPGMNGWQFREEQLRDPNLASIPVVLMTATHDHAKIDIEDVLYKPFETRRLIAVVERYAAPNDAFLGDSEMAKLMRSIDWSKTPVGPVETWSHAHRTMVEILLHNRFPMLLWWGPEFVQFYNDSYRPIPGDKHPRAMGQRGSECWSEIWDIIGPMAAKPFTRGESTTNDDLSVLIRRRGFLEETHFKMAYSPVPDSTVQPTGIGGVLATVAETTEQVYAERQLRTLRELGARVAEAKTAEDACTRAAGVLAENDWDVPFALLYLLHPDSGARLVASVGFDRDGPWPLDRVVHGEPEVIDDLEARFGALPTGRWRQAPKRAIVLPLGTPGETPPDGVLICGLSPHRALDEGYRGFFELAAAQIVAAIHSARAYEEERKRVEALAAIDRAKTAFFSNVSHEFRTPLTLMLGPALDLLSGHHGPLSSAQRSQLELMHRNGLRLQKLVNSLLDFSRLEAGRIQASYEPVDLAALTCDLASSFRAAIEAAGLVFEVECETISEPIYVDRDMWEKIVLNLVSNAFKFTFEGAIEVRVADAGDHVMLTVKDTGTGIAEHDMPRVFERFYRIENARARTHEGSGIGLALVQELAKLHGGSVRAESRAGWGSTFTVTIPKGSAHLPPERILAARTSAATALGPSPFVEEALRWLPELEEECDRSEESPGRILVADDNADMRDYVRRVLSRHWTVEAVKDGEEALAAARTRPPDLVLTDVMMPSMDGFELLRQLRSDERTKHIPVVMLSARAGEEARIEGLHAGAEDYLTKPFSARELKARVRIHVELARLRARIRAERERLFELFMQAPSPICVMRGEDLVFEMANELYFKVIGRRDLVGRPLLEVLPEFRGQGFDELLLGVLRTGKAFMGEEMRLQLDRRGDGNLEDTYWTFTYAPLKNAAGDVDCVIAICNEVSEQVRARDRLAKSEDRVRRLVTQVGAGIAQADRTGRFTLVNDRFCEMVGRSREELVELHMQEITHPDDLAETVVRFEGVVETGIPYVIEKRYVRPDGSIVWVQNSVSRIDDARGRAQGIAAVSIDITQRRRHERALRESRERLRSIFDSAAVSIWEEDYSEVRRRLQALESDHGTHLRGFLENKPALVRELAGLVRVRDVNAATLTMFGATAKEQLLRSLEAVFVPETYPVFLEALMAIAGGRDHFSAETALRTLGGEPLHVLLTMACQEGERSYERVLVTLTDISMRKTAEREREARVAEMERALMFSEMFVSILGHDLRNPLSAISTSAAFLSRHAASERSSKAIGRIVRSAHRMDRMIAQLLDFTRIRLGGGLPMVRKNVDLLEITRQVVEELESASKVAIPVRSVGDVTGIWDRDRLSQLVSNLAANACEHGVPGTVKILIDGCARDVVRIEVENGGVIVADKLAGIFDPLRNAAERKKTPTASRGLGLGLYITKQIATAHGGSIRVHSAEPDGTRFVVELPRLPATCS